MLNNFRNTASRQHEVVYFFCSVNDKQLFEQVRYVKSCFGDLTLTHCKTLPHWTSKRHDAGGFLATPLLILSMTFLFLHHFHPSIFTSRIPPPSCRTQVASVLVRARACCATINRYRRDVFSQTIDGQQTYIPLFFFSFSSITYIDNLVRNKRYGHTAHTFSRLVYDS